MGLFTFYQGVMPPFENLDQEQVSAGVTYVLLHNTAVKE